MDHLAVSGRVHPFAGVGALTKLAWLRLRARVRHFVRDLRRPRRFAVFLIMAFGLAVIALSPANAEARRHALVSGGVYELGGLLLLLPVLSSWAAVRQGVITFRPEEVHFLFPAPVTSRALLLAHLLTTLAKSLGGACLFTLFLHPPSAGYLGTALGYSLYLLFCVCLQVSVDLNCLRWPAARRRRRANLVVLVVVTLIAGAVALAWWQDGGRWTGPAVLRHAILPVLPFASVIGGGRLDGSLPWDLAVALSVVMVGALASTVLTFRGDVREAAHQASLVQAEAVARMRRGRIFVDGPNENVRGTLLPMLPMLRGAGVHAWRQLTVLLRSRTSFALLVVMTLAVGLGIGITKHAPASEVALAMLAVVTFAGPMFVQCDFRSDFECLPWLRTLPTPAGVLAAGQMLASTLVLYALQLALTGWSVFVFPAEARLPLVGAFLVLPVFNLLQFSVWNGAHLISPRRPGGSQAVTSASALLRLYATLIAVYAVIAAALAIAGLCFAAVWAGLPLLGLEDRLVRGIPAYFAGCAGLIAVTATAVWSVGRLFLRVDCSRDLTD